MAYCLIETGTIVTTHDYECLLSVYEQYRKCRELIKQFVMDGPLTPEQLASLPGPLRMRLTFVDASAESLERLASLPDPRGCDDGESSSHGC